MQTGDIEPPFLRAQECSAEEFEEICRWTAEKVWKRLDAWKNGAESGNGP
jgi:hypothetical protein